MNLAQLRQLAASVGFPDPAMAAAIAKAESNGNPGAVGDNGDSIGLWQIDTAYHPQYSKSDLADPTFNAQAAFAISSSGTNWRPWSTAWENAAQQIGYLGPSAPFQQFYQPGAVPGSWQRPAAIALGIVTVSGIAAWWLGRPRPRRSPRRRLARA